jgi:hypothetical protein
MRAIVRGTRPERPEKISDGLWSVLEKCWMEDPKERPGMREVAAAIQREPRQS